MGLLDLLRSEKQKAEAGKAALWNEYREILLRREAPTARDTQRLAALCDELGIDERSLQLQVWLLDQAAQLEAEQKEHGKVQVELDKLAAKAAPIEKQIGELRAKLEALYAPADELRTQLRDVVRITSQMELMQQRYPWLITGNTEAKPAQCGSVPGIPGLRDTMASLGLKDDLAGQFKPAMTALETFRLHNNGWPLGMSPDGKVPDGDGDMSPYLPELDANDEPLRHPNRKAVVVAK